MVTAFLVISGRVQGVFYRAKAKEMADKLGVTGWVKNTEIGNVEATVCGDENSVQLFIDWCKKGPSRAIVENVTVEYIGEEAFEQFKIIR